jgi:hypothetical protein
VVASGFQVYTRQVWLHKGSEISSRAPWWKPCRKLLKSFAVFVSERVDEKHLRYCEWSWSHTRSLLKQKSWCKSGKELQENLVKIFKIYKTWITWWITILHSE